MVGIDGLATTTSSRCIEPRAYLIITRQFLRVFRFLLRLLLVHFYPIPLYDVSEKILFEIWDVLVFPVDGNVKRQQEQMHGLRAKHHEEDVNQVVLGSWSIQTVM